MTLQVRITLLITAIFFFGVFSVIYRTIIHARIELETEVDAATELTSSLLSLNSFEDFPFTRGSRNVTREFIESAEGLLHVRFSTLGESGRMEESFERELDESGVPGWFISLLEPGSPRLIDSLEMPDGETLLIYNTTVDGVKEAWREAVSNLYSRVLSLGAFILTLLFFVGRWMRPVPVIVRVLREMAEGDYFRKVPKLQLPEFNEIGERINHLGSVLGASSAENDRLGRKAREIQEEERYYLAQELHDVQGQSMSAIKAIAVSLQQRAYTITPVEVEKNAERIEDIAQQSYDSVRDMMRSLRSFELDELGLVHALQQMADDWNDIHEETFCKLGIEGKFEDLDKTQILCVYRIVQEALTNVAKHARAETVQISLSGWEVVTVVIADDGVGLDERNMEEGMGMKGLRERVHLLDGNFSIETSHKKGLAIRVEFPRKPPVRRKTGVKFSA